MATPEEIAALEQETGLKVNDIINNPSGYGLNTEVSAVLEQLLLDETTPIQSISLWVNQALTNLANKNEPIVPINPFGVTSDDRYLTVKDEKGNPVIVDGQIQTVKVDKNNIFPATNFFDAFISSLTISQTAAIQDKAIEAGYITEEDLGDEVNGIKGNITKAFIAEVMNYAIEQMDSYAPGGFERNSLQDKIMQGFEQGTIDGKINSLFGGVDFANTQLSEQVIESREIFSIALDEWLNQAKADRKTIDIEAAKEIRAKVIEPTQQKLEDELFSLYKSLHNKEMSDRRKADFAEQIAKDWSPYVQALIAQDKAIRANEVYNTYYGADAFKAMGAEQQPVGGYVEFKELKPEFSVENPLEAAQRQLTEELESDIEFMQDAAQVEKMQKEYLAWRLGS